MRILIVEDEIELSRSMIKYLQQENYSCDAVYTYSEAIDKVESFEYDCILLDISLPDGSGLKILEALKKDHKTDGVIIISAKDSLDDKITGLKLGADDYLPKPFHLSELSARIEAVIRRKTFQGNNTLTLNELSFDLSARIVSVNDNPVDLTRKEYDLLLYLVSNKNRVISRHAIAERISGDSADVYDNFDFIYAHVKNLKKKLSVAGCEDYIQSIYGIGYKFTI
ncbi:MAG: response regulator transcription factor [Agriterribacter sp.]